MKQTKTAVMIYEFVAEDVDTRSAEVEKGSRAKGFRTHHKGDVREARIGPITIDAETVWHWEEIATRLVLPFEFYPDGWELDD